MRAIVESGGIYATVDQATSQQTFIAAALANGLTGIDAGSGSGSSTLLSGLATGKLLSPTSPNTFTYAVKAGETVNVTVTAVDNLALKVTLRDAKASKDINSTKTDSLGVAFLEYASQTSTDLEVVVGATNNTASGVFSIGLKSSLPLNGSCNITGNGTVGPATPTAFRPARFTGGAASVVLGVSANVFGAFVSVLGFAVAATWL